MTKQDILTILEKYKYLIENNDFNRFYLLLNINERHFFTDLFLKSNIDPLSYMLYIPEGYAAGLKNIESVIVPNNVTTIQGVAFWNCENLNKITLTDNIEEIEYNAFSYCENLENINLPKNITYIGENLFFECYKLKNITIPDKVTEIRYRAFQGCYDLEYIKIPKSVNLICEDAFNYCRNLKDIYYEGSVKDWLKINIQSGNFYLDRAKFHYNSKI